ncbi:E3 ubiquitin-protein ligase RNF14-like [Anomaloglossus baeobatrachus]|uniref:E3 ubiquitin-protein ligase RNF14-like n=1 Tax=Anomaloglossus baeobatrachus TaxID=238106 RepID=UPI003F50A4A7
MSREDLEAQDDELLALTSIYPEDEFRRVEAAPEGEIEICLELPSDFLIYIKSNCATNSFAENFENTVSFLPPIVLNFELPPDYPSAAPPDFTLSCKWLSPGQLTLLCHHLDVLWEENKGCVVLFPWIQFLKEETLDFLDIKSPYEIEVSSNGLQNWMQPPEKTPADGALFDKRAIQDVQSVSALVKYILVFSEAQEKKVFDGKPFLCNICFMEKLGSECTHFKDCQHVYCNNCLKDYFEVQIKDGQVHALNCPEPKCTSTATPAQVKNLVGEQQFSRYDRLLLQSSLDLMADVVYCPRLSCQTPVMVEPEGTMGICSVCHYAFCILCNMTFHGISPCKVTEEKNVDISEDNLTDDDEKEERRQLKKVQRKQNREWIKENSKSCPSCKVNIEKNGGCNRMSCSKCYTPFCWLCLTILAPDIEYKHFQDPAECLRRLQEREKEKEKVKEGEEEEEEEDDYYYYY